MPALDSTFPDRSSILFGREKDIAFLLERTERPGVTVVLGPPQMGKSWLLTEVARQLSARPGGADRLSLRGLSPLVGRVESEGEYADMLPRAVQDLYTRWLSDATYLEQAQTFFEQGKPDLLGRIGQAVGTLVKAVAPLHGPPGTAIGTLVKSSFDSLAEANRDLKSGGISLPSLQTADSRELLEIVFAVTARPAVLVLDQWEKSPDLDKETRILDTFLRHAGEWSPCHILVGTRPETRPRAQARKLRNAFPSVADSYLLKPMALDDPDVVAPLLASLRERVPATREVEDSTLLELIAGYPRVLSQWTSPYNARQLQTLEDLKRVAEEANSFRYPEFEQLLPELSDDQRAVAIRLALLPGTSDSETWKAIHTSMPDDFAGKNIDGLAEKGLLESRWPPAYGHDKRLEALQALLKVQALAQMIEVAEDLITKLSRNFGESTGSQLFSGLLFSLRALTKDLDLTPPARAMTEAIYAVYWSATHRLVGQWDEGWEDINFELLATVEPLSLEPCHLPLLAAGLGSSVAAATRLGKDQLVTQFLSNLRGIAGRDKNNVFAREELAAALSQTLFMPQVSELEVEHRLEELRELAKEDASSSFLRMRLANALFNTMHWYIDKDDQPNASRLAQELNELVSVNRADEILQKEYGERVSYLRWSSMGKWLGF